MILYLIQGATLAFPAAVMPGPFQAYLLSRALKTGWKKTLPASLAPVITDGPIITLVLFVLTSVPPGFMDLLRIGGGVFILFLARNALRSLKAEGPALKSTGDAARKTLFHAVMMNFLNPNPYLFWSIVSGPVFLTGWRQSPGAGIAFLAGFYGTFLCALITLIILFGTAGMIEARATRVLSLFAALALLAFGIYQVVSGVTALMV